ncbi:hypothetical protein [Dyadobacter sp. Leaf189]|uniref:hypothetical protein n=1 Tax=Dyadobacter sp. Leaf189 TaxID=1736295 RepID=UPI0006F4B9B6|nr:hypothetical protein [Dyadobacter sp. Leaf189]KQS23825.1 hypothetical protein ASG33_24715 [Dyadobacter sp. Leaf189]
MKDILLLIALSITHLTQAQINLTIDYNCKDSTSGFSTIEVIDNRDGQKLLGYIHKGLGNNSKQIVFEGSIADSLAIFFKGKNESIRNQKTLVFILNELFMNENTRDIPENGKLKLSLRLFLEEDVGKYSEILAVDSIFTVKGFDVTKKLFRSVSEEFCAIAKDAAESKLNEDKPTFTRDELNDLDSLEISRIPIFSNQVPNSGIFKDYAHFAQNNPDINARIMIEKSKKGKVTAYRYYGTRKKGVQLEPTGLYAISDGINLYKATSAGFFEIKNVNQRLYYDRPGSFTDANSGAMWGAYFGLAGSIVASSISASGNKNYLFRFKINHRRGNSIPIGLAE